MKEAKKKDAANSSKREVRELGYEELQKVVGGASLGFTYSTAPTVHVLFLNGGQRSLSR